MENLYRGVTKCNVCFKMCFGRIFNYRKYESVRKVLLCFKVLSFDLFVLRARKSKALKSNRSVVRKCAEIWRDEESFLHLLNMYNIDYNLDKVKVHQALWKHFEETVQYSIN